MTNPQLTNENIDIDAPNSLMGEWMINSLDELKDDWRKLPASVVRWGI